MNTYLIVISQNEHETQFLEMIKLLVSFQNGGDIVLVIIVMVIIYHEVGALECALSYLRGTIHGYKEVYTLLALAFKPT